MNIRSVRTASDGTFWIPRPDAEVEEYMDMKYTRLPNQLRWVSKIPNILDHYQDTHSGLTCHIVGKGPSLDDLNPAQFEPLSPVIALNEAIHKVEAVVYGPEGKKNPTYGVQLDNDLGEDCRPSNPETILFTSHRCAPFYQQGVKRVLVDPRSFHLPETCLSVQYAIEMAKMFGCTSLMLHCFDGCLTNEYDYALCVGYDSSRGGAKTRFKGHRPVIVEQAKGMRLAWVSPTGKVLEQGV